MRPRDTHYRLAATPRDYETAQAFQTAEGQEPAKMRYPTLLAERAGKVVGLLGTTPTEAWPPPFNTTVVVGPLTLARSLPRPIIVAWRLFEIYETILQQAGVRAVLWATDRQDPRWTRLLGSLGLVPYGQTEQHDWYLRHVGVWPRRRARVPA